MSGQDVAEQYAARAREVAELFLAGASVAEVSDQLGMYPSKVNRFLTFAGVDTKAVREQRRIDKLTAKRDAKNAEAIRRAEAAQALIDDTAQRYLNGETTTELARAYHVTNEAIRLRLKRAGVDLHAHREYLFGELDFLCGTDSFDNLCARLGTDIKAVRALCATHDRQALFERLSKTRITDYSEDQNAV